MWAIGIQECEVVFRSGLNMGAHYGEPDWAWMVVYDPTWAGWDGRAISPSTSVLIIYEAQAEAGD